MPDKLQRDSAQTDLPPFAFQEDISLEETQKRVAITLPLKEKVRDVENALSSPAEQENVVAFSSAEAASRPGFSSLQAVVETGLIITGLLAIFFLLPRNTGGDGWVRYQALLDILIRHQRPMTKYSLIGPSFALPLTWIGRKLGDAYDWTIVYNQLLFAATLLSSYLLLRKHVSRALLRTLYLLLICASMLVAHLSLFYTEVFTALLVGFGLMLANRTFRFPFGWLVVAVGVANIPATLGGLALVVLARVIESKRLRYGLVVLAAVALILLEAWLLRGSPTNLGYADDHGQITTSPYSGLPGFSYPIFFGVLGLLFSFGKGVLFFAPGLFLPVRQTLLRWYQGEQVPLARVYQLWLAFVVGLVLVYAHWWAWEGGAFWGPRFLLFASLPASLALAVRLRHCEEASLALNLGTLLVLVLSVWVCLDGALFQWVNGLVLPAVCGQNHAYLEMVCVFTPEYSPLWAPFVFHYPLTLQQKLFIGFVCLVAMYLAFPLCRQIVRQMADLLKHCRRVYSPLNGWRV